MAKRFRKEFYTRRTYAEAANRAERFGRELNEALGREKDLALLAWAFAHKLARWEPFTDGKSGELCFAGLRHCTELDSRGVPKLTPHARALMLRLKNDVSTQPNGAK